MNPEPNPGPRLSAILTPCIKTALYEARTSRYPFPLWSPTELCNGPRRALYEVAVEVRKNCIESKLFARQKLASSGATSGFHAVTLDMILLLEALHCFIEDDLSMVIQILHLSA
jgi:hypothetical protein